MSRTLEKEIETAVTMTPRLKEFQLKNLWQHLAGRFYDCTVKIEHTEEILLVTIHRKEGFTSKMYRFKHDELMNYLNGFRDGIKSVELR